MTQHPASGLQVALYVHIPFCAARCHYCDFNTVAGLEALYEPYVTALGREIRRAGEAAGRPHARTIFIGGGTPTVLPVPLLARMLEACFAAFAVDPSAEITCEANPGTTDQECFAGLRALGVNRLSLGVQSFDDAELRWLGRIHTADEAGRAFDGARAAGFDNINLDLIFGLPEKSEAGIWGLGEEDKFKLALAVTLPRQAPGSPTFAGANIQRRISQSSWQRTLARAVELGPEHLSLYSLTVEPGTPLGRQVRSGRIPAPDDDLAADLYETACDALAHCGYTHYEISNWAGGANQQVNESANQRIDESANERISESTSPSPLIPASRFHRCRHNLVYWRREPYLGFGAGAHSFDGVRRTWNVRSVSRYIERVEAGLSPRAGGERVGRRSAMGETMMLGLRLLEEGVPDERFRAQFGAGLEDVFGAEIGDLVARGLLERLPDRVRLTAAGALLGNRVFAEFMDGDDCGLRET